jgi:3-isopropylmalate dehydratase small subunit
MVQQKITGKAWCYGDNINTDLIYPGRYLIFTEPQDMAKYAMADVDTEFNNKFQKGDILIAGENFGCGSSREQAAMCLKYAGISAIIARSYARIFYRNTINQGIPAFISPKASSIVSSGTEIELDLANNHLINLKTDEKATLEPLPEFLLKIINDGGIIHHLRKRLEK